jgi:hypothetical protein
MNANDPLPKSTADLLRAPLPDRGARPGLETRLLASIHGAPAPSIGPWRLVLGTACAVLLLAAVLVPLLHPADPPVITTVPSAAERPVLEITEFPNPLKKEAVALRSTASRASRFLINCLPSIPAHKDQL